MIYALKQMICICLLSSNPVVQSRFYDVLTSVNLLRQAFILSRVILTAVTHCDVDYIGHEQTSS